MLMVLDSNLQEMRESRSEHIEMLDLWEGY